MGLKSGTHCACLPTSETLCVRCLPRCVPFPQSFTAHYSPAVTACSPPGSQSAAMATPLCPFSDLRGVLSTENWEEDDDDVNMRNIFLRSLKRPDGRTVFLVRPTPGRACIHPSINQSFSISTAVLRPL